MTQTAAVPSTGFPSHAVSQLLVSPSPSQLLSLELFICSLVVNDFARSVVAQGKTPCAFYGFFALIAASPVQVALTF